ncbi:MAG: helix-turn-helix domain-containing protein [Solirubrobacteraceae bacterium]
MALFDLVGRRWTLRIIWELHQAPAPLTFRALREACGAISSSVLTRRLGELDDALIVEHTGSGYALTETGEQLVVSLAPVLSWSEEWSRRLTGGRLRTS